MESRASAARATYPAGVSITAIVPLKALRFSKQRLASRVPADERQALMGRLFTHVLRTCADTPGITSVLAVVGDAGGAALAREVGVPSMRERGGGLNAALREATAHVDGDASLVVVADLPRLSVTDLRRVVAAGAVSPCVVVASTHDGGTGALLRRPPAVIAPAFGPASASAHLDAAQQAGVRAILLTSRGLADDLDRPGDLDRFAGGGSDRHTV